MAPSEFRFAAKYGLFTYAQCGDLDPFAVVDHFASLGSECIIGREDHADGGTHLHAFAMWESKFNSRDARKFDVCGHHPNVVAGYGTPEKGWDYATKDGEIVGGGLERPSRNGVGEAASKWSEIVASETAEQFWDATARLDPRALCCSFVSLEKFVAWKYRPLPTEYESPEGVTFDTGELGQLPDWVDSNLGGGSIGERSPLSRYHHRSGPTLRSGLRSARVSPGLANPLRWPFTS